MLKWGIHLSHISKTLHKTEIPCNIIAPQFSDCHCHMSKHDKISTCVCTWIWRTLIDPLLHWAVCNHSCCCSRSKEHTRRRWDFS